MSRSPLQEWLGGLFSSRVWKRIAIKTARNEERLLIIKDSPPQLRAFYTPSVSLSFMRALKLPLHFYFYLKAGLRAVPLWTGGMKSHFQFVRGHVEDTAKAWKACMQYFLTLCIADGPGKCILCQDLYVLCGLVYKSTWANSKGWKKNELL